MFALRLSLIYLITKSNFLLAYAHRNGGFLLSYMVLSQD